MDWNYIISFMGGSVAFFGAAAWLTQSLVTQLFLKNAETYKASLAKEAETYKAELLAQYNLSLEKFKADLSKVNSEHQVRFSLLHEKRAEVVAELYNLIVETHSSFECCKDTFDDEKEEPQLELANETIERCEALHEHVIRNQIYFSPFLAAELRELDTCLTDAAYSYKRYCEKHGETEIRSEISGLLGEVAVDIMGAMRTTEEEFRKLLGVELKYDY